MVLIFGLLFIGSSHNAIGSTAVSPTFLNADQKIGTPADAQLWNELLKGRGVYGFLGIQGNNDNDKDEDRYFLRLAAVMKMMADVLENGLAAEESSLTFAEDIAKKFSKMGILDSIQDENPVHEDNRVKSMMILKSIIFSPGASGFFEPFLRAYKVSVEGLAHEAGKVSSSFVGEMSVYAMAAITNVIAFFLSRHFMGQGIIEASTIANQTFLITAVHLVGMMTSLIGGVVASNSPRDLARRLNFISDLWKKRGVEGSKKLVEVSDTRWEWGANFGLNALAALYPGLATSNLLLPSLGHLISGTLKASGNLFWRMTFIFSGFADPVKPLMAQSPSYNGIAFFSGLGILGPILNAGKAIKIDAKLKELYANILEILPKQIQANYDLSQELEASAIREYIPNLQFSEEDINSEIDSIFSSLTGETVVEVTEDEGIVTELVPASATN